MALLKFQGLGRFRAIFAVAATLALAGLAPMSAPAQAAPETKSPPAKSLAAKQPAVATPAPTPSEPAAPERVKVGLFITQLYDFDMAKRAFNVTFWAWFLHTDDKYKPIENIEIVNAKSSTIRFPSSAVKDDIMWEGKKDKVHWDQVKYTSSVSQEWDVTNFPFDRQELKIFIEDGLNDVTQTILEADTENSKIDDPVKVPGWTIESFRMTSGDSVYKTTYGDPTLQGTSTYSRVVATIVVKRDGIRLLFSMFVGFFVAFALTCLTFFLDTDMMAGSRIGLCGGAIFASVGNKYVVDSYLPPVSTFTLADAIELSTFLAIIFSILVVVIKKACDRDRPKLASWINHIGVTLNAGGYLLYNGLMIMWAAAG